MLHDSGKKEREKKSSTSDFLTMPQNLISSDATSEDT